jgi:outer membrane lipoprotein SlyB
MSTFSSLASRIALLLGMLVLGACAAPGAQPGSMSMRKGTTEQVTPTQIQGSHHVGIGAVAGGLAGVAPAASLAAAPAAP